MCHKTHHIDASYSIHTMSCKLNAPPLIYLSRSQLQEEGTHSHSNSCPQPHCLEGHSDQMSMRFVHCYKRQISAGIHFGSVI